jgi:DNA replication protein DnaC
MKLIRLPSNLLRRRFLHGNCKSLRAFDFDASGTVDPAVIHTLAMCGWVKKGMPLCLVGDSDTGKSHLLIARSTRDAATAGGPTTRVGHER